MAALHRKETKLDPIMGRIITSVPIQRRGRSGQGRPTSPDSDTLGLRFMPTHFSAALQVRSEDHDGLCHR
jgi:hypothetical protein